MILADSEFGEIIVRRNALAKNISFSRSTSGRLQMSVPSYVSERQIQKSLDSMRDRLRGLNLADPATQRARDAQKKLLMKQAKEYLPYRLEYLAKRYSYHYDHVTLKHQSTRWGSCTRRKTPVRRLRVHYFYEYRLNARTRSSTRLLNHSRTRSHQSSRPLQSFLAGSRKP